MGAKGPRYTVPYRRRTEKKTDYRARRALITSGKPRVVIRGSKNSMLAQIIKANPSGDEVIVSAHSRELMNEYGWKAHGGNLPTAYLTGLLCGVKAQVKGVEEAIADIGLQAPSKGARIFAALKGVADGKVRIPFSEEKLPNGKRIEGNHIAAYAKSLSQNPEIYQHEFSSYMKKQMLPESLPVEFEKTKNSIMTGYKSGGKKT